MSVNYLRKIALLNQLLLIRLFNFDKISGDISALLNSFLNSRPN